jgi:uncharacterized RDD family membrane protein YckC
MKTCTKCSQSNIPDSQNYCPNCGSRDIIVATPALASPSDVSSSIAPASATRTRRLQAFGIDLVGIFIVSAISSVPFLGVLPALIVTLYQLLRDYSGASIGKRVLGLTVVSKGGGRASPMQCIIRNVVFVVPSLALFLTAFGIPGLGFLIDGAVLLFIYVIEFASLLSTGSRIGDRLANTSVVPA